ncbi:MAG: hypothetical protein QM714_00290 [Nocardioides sp.]|uniref:hypothetical protein n=1 Tax=Nocardioides sp. TaxID=35761 RepID=UPI0039E4807A
MAALRAVTPDEKAPPKTVTQAAATGTHRELLVAMRDRIAKAVEDPKCPPRDLAALTRRLHEIAREIENNDAADEHEVASRGENLADEKFDPEAI